MIYSIVKSLFLAEKHANHLQQQNNNFMKRIFHYAALFIVAMMMGACSQNNKYETVKGDPMHTQMYTLKNGLKVYMSVNKETPRIQTFIAVKVGGKNDPAETTGLAHYFEHLMFKGTEQFGTSDYAAEKPMLDQIENLFEVYRKNTDEKQRAEIYHQIDSISYEASKYFIPNEYDKLMAIIGATGTNAFTSQDMTVYQEDIPSNEIDNWARIQADRFKNPVIRGFHTELETIYEEKNMSLTDDYGKVSEALDAALFPHHPYGTQTVLGTQEHLKNPSITNVKNYHKTYYVPNNMAICVSGDFNPDEMVATIEKYFGDMQPNPNIPKLQFEKEKPITAPIVKEVYGLQAANVTMAWPLPGASEQNTPVSDILSSVFYNGMAGLIDLDVMQQQKVLSAYGYAYLQPDYGQFVVSGKPKTGQTLEQVRDILLEEVAKLRNGDFSEDLVKAAINNYKKDIMKSLENNESRAMMYVSSFINGTNWADEVKAFQDLEKITKQDIVNYAQKYLPAEGYAIVYKREGEDKNIQKISAPKITPIMTNRDNQSKFLEEIQKTPVKPIEPVFVDYKKDLSVTNAKDGVEVLYKKNETNDIFTLIYAYDKGILNDPALALAFDYVSYLGTADKTPEQISMEMYKIACSMSMGAGSNQSSIYISGLSENMPQAIKIVEDLVYNAVGDEKILANLKADCIQERANAKLNQGQCFNKLISYMTYGPEYVRQTTLSDDEINKLTSDELLAKVRDFFNYQHDVLYYGPMNEKDFLASIKENHKTADTLQPLKKLRSEPVLTNDGKNNVYMAQYDAKQLYYYQYSNRGEKYNYNFEPEVTLYNEYFGGGMNSIVFQEMREARGLAYSANATLAEPSYADGVYYYYAFIATQNDKMKQAIQAFDDIINNMPESEAAFKVAKESLIGYIRTARIVRENVLWSYLNDRELGNTESSWKIIFEKVQGMTLDDVKAAQQKWVKGRNYNYGILGDIKDLDTDYLKTLGKVTILSSEDIFGY